MKTIQIVLTCILLSLPMAALAATFEVTVEDSGFNPASLIINKGDTVRWTNKGTTLHSATSGISGVPDGNFDSGPLNPGVTFEQTFTLSGEVGYFDKTAALKTGSIIIDDNKIIISPATTVLLPSQNFDLVIYRKFFGRVNQHVSPLKIAIIFDGVALYDDFLDNFYYLSSPIYTIDGGSAKKIPIPPYTLSPGVHILSVNITTASGVVVSDKAIYTVLEEGSFSP
ncbi:MAG: hypothetical protein HZA17_04835 [Nitrospirae bacterium]|nr:hypothetical protein [Nitrospirota bacterium]